LIGKKLIIKEKYMMHSKKGIEEEQRKETLGKREVKKSER
jgi:hypothetical protein